MDGYGHRSVLDSVLRRLRRPAQAAAAAVQERRRPGNWLRSGVVAPAIGGTVWCGACSSAGGGSSRLATGKTSRR
jgi:hypothetical protein